MRLIDADALIARIMEDVPDFLDGGSSITKAFILAMLRTRKATPTIDAVPVVRCKDCQYHDAGENEVDAWNRCRFHHIDTDDNKFCSDGERKEP